MGRMKYVRPLFRDLVENEYRELAREIYIETKDFYNPVLVNHLNTSFGFD